MFDICLTGCLLGIQPMDAQHMDASPCVYLYDEQQDG